MGHLYSCHRTQTPDKGRSRSKKTSVTPKTESSLLRQLHQRCIVRQSMTPDETGSPIPPSPLLTSASVWNDDDSEEACRRHPTDATNFERGGRPATSLPSSPLLGHNAAETLLHGPHSERSGSGDKGEQLLEPEDDDSMTNESSSLRVGSRTISTSVVDFSSSGFDTVVSAGCSRSSSGREALSAFDGWSTLPIVRHSNSASKSFDATVMMMTSHAIELIVAADVQPEVVVEFLCRRDVVNEETVAAVRRCATKRSACELIAEVVIGKGRAETSTLVEALRAAGANHFADCLECVDGLLSLKRTLRKASMRRATSRYNGTKAMSYSKPSIDEHHPILLSYESLVGKLDIDIVYVDPISGLVIETDGPRSDVTSAVRHPRHRSVIVDVERMSLPTYFLRTTSANNVCVAGTDDVIASDVSGRTPSVALTLTGFHLSDWLVDKIGKLLFQFSSSLRILSLVKCNYTNRCLERLRKSATDRKSSDGRPDLHLIRLNVGLSRDTVDGTCICGSGDDNGNSSSLTSSCHVSAWSSLRSLSLTGSGLTSNGCSILFRDFVAKSRLLVELDIGFNDVADARPIADALSDNCTLRRLRIRSNSISADGATMIFEALRRNYRLEDLDISGNSIGSLVAYSKINELPLVGGTANSTTAAGCAKSRFDELPLLTTSSNDNHCDDKDVQFPVGLVGQALAEAFVCNRTLRELRVERCGLGLDECRGIGRGLLTNATLTVLDLSANPAIGDLGLAAVAVPLCRNGRCAIGTLSMNMCSISDLGLRTLLSAIIVGCSDNITDFNGNLRTWNTTGKGNLPKGHTRLERIKLCYNNIRAAIVTSNKNNYGRQLHRIDHRVNSRSDENVSDCRQLSDSIPNRNSSQMNGNTKCEACRQCHDDVLLSEGQRASELHSSDLSSAGTSNMAASSSLQRPHQSGVRCSSLFLEERHNRESNASDSELVAAPSCRRVSSASRRHHFSQYKPEMLRPEVTCDQIGVYQLLCDVLAANPNLKILLWGNNKHGNLNGKHSFLGVREEVDNDFDLVEDDRDGLVEKK